MAEGGDRPVVAGGGLAAGADDGGHDHDGDRSVSPLAVFRAALDALAEDPAAMQPGAFLAGMEAVYAGLEQRESQYHEAGRIGHELVAANGALAEDLEAANVR